MKNKLYVLEDSPLVIMLYELWCKKFGLTLILHKTVDQFWKNELPKKSDYCLLDINLVSADTDRVADFVSALIISTNCLMTIDEISSARTFMQLPVYSKIKALELLETMHFTRDNNLKESTFL